MLVFYGILTAVVVAGGVALTALHKMHWTAFVATAAAALLLPLPVNAIGLAVAKADQQTFHEYWNGYETRAYAQDVRCERDGSCTHTYSCDPYTVVETEYYTDSDGKRQSRPVTKTKYHSCPYSTQETSYYVDSTLKTFTIASSLMTGEQYRWGTGIPGGQVTSPPELWRQAEARIAAGNPAGVTTVNSYKNFILTSETTVFKRYSGLIEELRADGKLPEVAKGLSLGPYTAQKLSFVGELPQVDRARLSQELVQLNGALGAELRGDLHVALVDATAIAASPEDYGNALLAYWQNPEIFGKDALGKNAIVLIVGVKGYTSTPTSSPSSGEVSPAVTSVQELTPGTPVVAWARAATGMPVGNERLLRQLSSELPGIPVTENFFGSPTYDVASGEVVHTAGVVEEILWGPNKFERVSMSAKDEEDAGSGFAYLSDEWQPDAATLTWIYIISGLLAALALGGGFFATWTLRSNGRTDFVRYLFTKH
jgi:hypothetical protein